MQGAWKAFLQKVFYILGSLLPRGSTPVIDEVSKLREKLKIHSAENLKPAAVPEMWVDRYVILCVAPST